jgi:hypothetical protein
MRRRRDAAAAKRRARAWGPSTMRTGLMIASLLSALGAPAVGMAAGFGANESDPGRPGYEDYRRCYVLDVWRLSQAPDQNGAEARSLIREGRQLGSDTLSAGSRMGRSQGWVTSDIRAYTNERLALYQAEASATAGAGHAAEDTAFCQQRGLISRPRQAASTPSP